MLDREPRTAREARERFRAARARLTNPRIARADPGIDLKRRPEPIRSRRRQADRDAAAQADVLPGPTVAEVMAAVARHYGVTLDELCSQRRDAAIVEPRHIAYYLARRLTRHSLPAIGIRIGGRDHTTILHGFQRIRGRLADGDGELAARIAAIERSLGKR